MANDPTRSPEEMAAMMNDVDRAAGAFATALGLVMESVDPDLVKGHMDIEPRHLQPWGIVHGGVYSTIIETLASIGAAVSVVPDGRTAAGMENHTSFLRSISTGRVTAEARALHRGRTTHLWEVDIRDDRGRLVAHGKVRMAILDARAQ